MLEQEYVLPRTQLLDLTTPSGENVIAQLDIALTILDWGWLRFYFVNGATGNVYPYVEIPRYLNKYVDEATYGYDDTIPSHVHFNFERQEPGVGTIPWNEVRHTFKADGGHLFDDQQASIKYERSNGLYP